MNWHFSYRKAAIFLFLVFLGIFGFLYFTSSAVAISRIEISGDRLQVGDTVEATAYFSDWEHIDSVDVVVNGIVVLTCAGAPSCSMSHVLFPEEIGEHEYVFVVTDKKGKKTKSGGTYTVVTDEPEITQLTTNNTTFPVGGALYVQVDAKSESPVTSAKVYVDGDLKQYCLVVPCVAAIGPFIGEDEGQHTYSIVITNQKGKTITPGGMFTVLPEKPTSENETPAPLSIPELVSFHISKPQPVAGETSTVTVEAKDEKGIAAIIIFYDKKNIGGCNNGNICAVTLGPFNDAEAGTHAVDVMVINKDGKKIDIAGAIMVHAKQQTGSSGGANNDSSNKQPEVKKPDGSQAAAGQANGGSQPAQGNNGGGSNAQPAGSGSEAPANGNNIQPNPANPTQGSGGSDSPIAQPQVPVVPPKNDITPEASGPQLVYIASQGYALYLGDTFSANILVKDEKGIEKITAYVDGKIVATCEKLVVCSIKKGPFIEGDLGSHTYSFLVKNTSGKTIEPKGVFTVSKPASATVPANVIPPFDDNISFNNFDEELKKLPKQIPEMVPFDIQNISKNPLWIDTDGGIKEFTIGKCVSNVKDAPYQKSIQDYCVDKKQLVEFYVDGAAEKCLSKQITCGNLCYEGRCYAEGTRPGAGYTAPSEPPSRPGAGYTPPSEPPSRPGAGYTPPSDPPSRPGAGYTPPLWIDTDGGIKEYTVGQCVSNVQGAPYQKSIQDYCVDKKQLVEFYLESAADKCHSKQITCESVCYEGRCYAEGTRPGAGYTAPSESPSRPGAGYTPPSEPPSRPGAGYTPPADAPSRPGAGYTPPLWIDTDGGIKEFALGQCVSNVQGAPYQKSIEDYCVDKKQLVEYYLDDSADKCLTKQVTCENLCYGGRCYAPGTRPGSPAYNPPSYYETEPASRPTYEAPPDQVLPRPTYEAPTSDVPTRPTYEAPATFPSR